MRRTGDWCGRRACGRRSGRRETPPRNGPMTTPAVRLSVVIPAFNEGPRIGATLDELRAHLPAMVPSWEVRVVDDGSTDDTAQVVETIARDDARIVLQRE